LTIVFPAPNGRRQASFGKPVKGEHVGDFDKLAIPGIEEFLHPARRDPSR